MEIILASRSPRRRELLKLIVNDFSVFSVDTDETADKSLTPREKIEAISLKKAAAVREIEPGAVIISADTAVFLGTTQYGKPKNSAEAEKMLKSLSGNTHSVITAYTVIKGETTVTKSEETRVTFREITSGEIAEYIALGEPFDKAGGYGIQGAAAKFCEKIEGDYTSVVGLPVCSLAVTLRQLGVIS